MEEILHQLVTIRVPMKHCKFHRIPNGINHQLVQDFETVHSMFVVAVAVAVVAVPLSFRFADSSLSLVQLVALDFSTANDHNLLRRTVPVIIGCVSIVIGCYRGFIMLSMLYPNLLGLLPWLYIVMNSYDMLWHELHGGVQPVCKAPLVAL